jgi:hypothetical protein
MVFFYVLIEIENIKQFVKSLGGSNRVGKINLWKNPT